MKLANCRSCGKLFQSVGDKICSECRILDQEQYGVVKNFIQQNPTAPVYQVSSETNVPVKKILQYVREGRLVALTSDSDLNLECINCGTKIATGRLCPACEREFSKKRKSLNQAYEERVHIRDKFRDVP